MLRSHIPRAAALMLLSLLVAAGPTRGHQLLQAESSDSTPPEGGQVSISADLPVPDRFWDLGSDAPNPSPSASTPASRRLLSPGKKDKEPLIPVIQWSGKSEVKKHIPRVKKGTRVEGNRPRWVSATADVNTVTPESSSDAKLNATDARNLNIIDVDDRTIYYDMNYPWGTVVLISNSIKTGSGVLIGPRHVLTASHVINWDGWNRVEVGRYGNSVVATSYARTVWAYTKIRGSTVSYSDKDEDYAVITLQDDLGNRFGWMGTRTYDSSWDGDSYWTNIAYPGDRYVNDPGLKGLYPTVQYKKWLNEEALDFGPARAMTTNADIYKRMSGSPMFAWWSGQSYPSVVAVVSNEGDTFLGGYQNWCAGGSYLTSLVKYVRDHDP